MVNSNEFMINLFLTIQTNVITKKEFMIFMPCILKKNERRNRRDMEIFQMKKGAQETPAAPIE